jgi:hypothetical protein
MPQKDSSRLDGVTKVRIFIMEIFNQNRLTDRQDIRWKEPQDTPK